MKTRVTVAMAGAAVLALAGPARAAVLFWDDFSDDTPIANVRSYDYFPDINEGGVGSNVGTSWTNYYNPAWSAGNWDLAVFDNASTAFINAPSSTKANGDNYLAMRGDTGGRQPTATADLTRTAVDEPLAVNFDMWQVSGVSFRYALMIGYNGSTPIFQFSFNQNADNAVSYRDYSTGADVLVDMGRLRNQWQNWDITFDLGAVGTSDLLVSVDGGTPITLSNGLADTTSMSSLRFYSGGQIVGLYYDNVRLETVEAVAVPEPGTLALLACGLLGLPACAWRKRKSKRRMPSHVGSRRSWPLRPRPPGFPRAAE